MSKKRSSQEYAWKQRGIDITYEEYQFLKQTQEFKCACCGLEEKNLKRNLAVDHCHSTGKIRGLLCASCNMGLGYFKDNIDLLKKAIQYLGMKNFNE